MPSRQGFPTVVMTSLSLSVFLVPNLEAAWEPERRHTFAVRCHNTKHHGRGGMLALVRSWLAPSSHIGMCQWRLSQPSWLSFHRHSKPWPFIFGLDLVWSASISEVTPVGISSLTICLVHHFQTFWKGSFFFFFTLKKRTKLLEQSTIVKILWTDTWVSSKSDTLFLLVSILIKSECT